MRLVLPSVEVNLGRGVSLGATGLFLPREAGGVNGGGAVDLRVSLVQRKRVALALGAMGTGTYSSGDAYRSVPASAQLYAVGTMGGAQASATLGVGVRAQGANEFRAFPGDTCVQCTSWNTGPPTYRVRVRPHPAAFGGVEAEIARSGPFGYRLLAEGMALPVAHRRYTVLAGGGLRVTHKRARLDIGAMAGSEAWGRSERTGGVAPWVSFTAGL